MQINYSNNSIIAAYNYGVQTGEYKFHLKAGGLERHTETEVFEDVQASLKGQVSDCLFSSVQKKWGRLLVLKYPVKDQFNRDAVGANVLCVNERFFSQPFANILSLFPHICQLNVQINLPGLRDDLENYLSTFYPQTKRIIKAGQSRAIMYNAAPGQNQQLRGLFLSLVSLLAASHNVKFIAPKTDIMQYRNFMGAALGLLPDNGMKYNYSESCDSSAVYASLERRHILPQNYTFDFVNNVHPNYKNDFYAEILEGAFNGQPFNSDRTATLIFLHRLAVRFGRNNMATFLREYFGNR